MNSKTNLRKEEISISVGQVFADETIDVLAEKVAEKIAAKIAATTEKINQSSSQT